MTSTQVSVKFKRLHPQAVLPTREVGNAAFDLVIPEEVVLQPFQPTLVSLGFSTEFPGEFYANIKPRSSSLPRKGTLVVEGVVDSTYRGEWKLSLMLVPEVEVRTELSLMPGEPLRFGGPPVPTHKVLHFSPDSVVLEAGSRVAQVVFLPVPAVTWEETREDLSETLRGTKGFGEGTGL